MCIKNSILLKIYANPTWKRVCVCTTLEVQHISRIECMDSWGAPTSTVAMPNFDDMIGPIVEPHGESLRTTKSCNTHRNHTYTQIF